MKARIFALALCLGLLLCFLPSCGGGIDMGEAKVFIGDFLNAVGSGDTEAASEFLHPDLPMQLASYLEDVEKELGISFKDGITVKRNTGMHYAYYDSTVGGSMYEQSMNATVGTKEIYLSVTVVQNEAGYGVYDLEISI